MWALRRALGLLMDEQIPEKRSGHVAVVWDNVMFVWGGYYAETGSESIDYRHDSHIIWMYDLDCRKWSKEHIRGYVPPRLLATCYTCVNNCLIIFGGISQEDGDSNNVYCFDLKDRFWRKVRITGKPPSGRNKLSCCTFNNRIIYFAGYGPRPENIHINNGDFHRDLTAVYPDRGWNNHLFAFDLDDNCWVTLPNLGPKPSSRAAHACVAIGSKAYVFGGRHLDRRLNDMHMLCLHTFTWTTIVNQGVVPVGRSWHSMTYANHNTVFVFGGLNSDQNIFSDGWLYDVDKNVWTEIDMSVKHPRLWHSACIGAYLGEVVIFAGCENNIFLENPKHSNKLVTFNLQPKPLLRICLESLSEHQKQWSGKKEALPTSLYNKLSSMAGNGG
uniref:Kelch domain-containing protein 2 n=1 Tax=Phallusia mammillata TaxID=59560 RepID=A0A6F9DFC2_9ASCI|nr:kelch domain-containing protein 2 [Phallusia mammillata]